jgi:hypothetical protein
MEIYYKVSQFIVDFVVKNNSTSLTCGRYPLAGPILRSHGGNDKLTTCDRCEVFVSALNEKFNQ